jgi:tryptophanyl-tRNA synthetase
VLRRILGPIRERRQAVARDPDTIIDIVKSGTARARTLTAETLESVRSGLGLFRFA